MSRPADAKSVEQALKAVSGVQAVVVDGSNQTATVRYEITETDYRALRVALKDAGFALSDGWWARRRSNWFQNLDLTGRENARVRPSPCCNKPPTKPT